MVIRKTALLAVELVLLQLLAGCGRSSSPASNGAASLPVHSHTPKYGGVLVEVGQHEFNLEVLVDPVVGKITVWTLDAHAENYVRVTAAALEVTAKVNEGPEKSVVLPAVANPATGEIVGNTAQFEGLADWLKGAKDVAGVVKSVTLGARTFNDLKFDWPHGTTGDHAH